MPLLDGSDLNDVICASPIASNEIPTAQSTTPAISTIHQIPCVACVTAETCSGSDTNHCAAPWVPKILRITRPAEGLSPRTFA
ncbi:Uncharacterised protein [Mycobacteroides abscessus subsp. abscessus]|nr:Uncharacterised protein [Mycobacteroides abscessus subsp. abscessus]